MELALLILSLTHLEVKSTPFAVTNKEAQKSLPFSALYGLCQFLGYWDAAFLE